ncbi:hypothetical protein FANTH_4030 [Fusarium anthophilum]|uniref:Uncharacterized protein n=1 Tax=Fusarium anthophilum TaxID=48485 RepID=A0A8H4ZQH5_9HYPO|nr:hypothetical protein FANTH_4030 [Fusarium anthophilum]
MLVLRAWAARSSSRGQWEVACWAFGDLKRNGQYIKHVGRHLEQLSLHALPKIGDEELEDEVSELGAISADENSEASSKSHEPADTDEPNNQEESSVPDIRTMGLDGEDDVNDGEVPDGLASMSPTASS